MHFSENIFLLGGKMAAVRPPFCAYCTEKEHQKHFLFEFFSDKNIVSLFLMPQQTLDWARLGQYKIFFPT
jgi:hypothetical protein